MYAPKDTPSCETLSLFMHLAGVAPVLRLLLCNRPGSKSEQQHKGAAMRIQHVLRVATVFTIATLMLVPAAVAQSANLRADVPFDFYVSGKLMPAGTYTIMPFSQGNAIQITDSRGNTAFVLAGNAVPNKSIQLSRLVFHKYGDRAFLSNIYWSGARDGRELPSSKMELLARQQHTEDNVRVVAK
jgi:hypothetical protein